MKKTNAFLSLVPMATFALTSFGCTKTDALGGAGNDDSGVAGGAGSGGATGIGGATVLPEGGNSLIGTWGATALPVGGNSLIGTGGATALPVGGNSLIATGSTRNPVAWTTPTVSLTADDFWIVADGLRFTSKVAAVNVNSDPGVPFHTTLEITWTELGREMRFSIYLSSDSTSWWSDQMATYDAQTPYGSWLAYDGHFFKSAIGQAYRGDIDLTNDASEPIRGELHLHGLVLSTTLGGGAGNSSLLDMLPADNEVSTWVHAGGVSLITDQTGLYNQIDGAAPKYIDRGWVSSVYANYSQGARTIQVAIADMGSAANAQAIYNYVLPASREDLFGLPNATADMGLPTAYAIYAYRDRFFIELNIYEKSDAALTSLELFLSDIRVRINTGTCVNQVWAGGANDCSSSLPLPCAPCIACDPLPSGSSGGCGAPGISIFSWHGGGVDTSLSYPVGCVVRLPTENPYYPGGPQDCQCDADTLSWLCPI